MCAKGFISTVPDMLQPSLLNGVDLLVESVGGGKFRIFLRCHLPFLIPSFVFFLQDCFG